MTPNAPPQIKLMLNDQPGSLLGVLGGLGPLASAAFLATIYEEAASNVDSEQGLPPVVLYSDPNFPDRTSALVRGETGHLVQATTRALGQLASAGAERFIICCFTVHAVLDQIAPRLASRIIPLPDIALEQVATSNSSALLLGTTGSRHLGVFQHSPWWAIVRERIIHLERDDQAAFHALLYKLKLGGDVHVVGREIAALCRRYGTRTWIAGCSELHLVTRAMRSGGDTSVVDPLLMFAQTLTPASQGLLSPRGST